MNLIGLFEKSDHLERYSANDAIFVEGTPGDLMYVIVTGQVEVQLRGRTVHTAVAGEIFGEMALIDDSARSASAIAKTDCVLAPIDETLFLHTVDRMPSFALHVMRVLADRLRSMDARM